MKPLILGITPARGGSKGVPGKNIKPLCGKPLLAWTIAQARASKLLSRYIVSTEDARVARTARRFKAEVLARPAELATDEAATEPVLRHALEAVPADVVVLIQCTSPVRRPGLIDLCVRKFLESGADSLATVLEDRSYEYGKDMPRRQEIAPRLVDNGNVYVMRADIVRRGERFGRRIATLSVSREESVEIDEPYDFWLAGQVLRARPPRLWAAEEPRLFVMTRP